MGVIETDKIRGYHRSNGSIVCANCVENDDGYEEDAIITDDMVDDTDHYYFCDECKKRL